MTNPEVFELAQRYVATWNALDPVHRRSLLGRLYGSNSRLTTATSSFDGLEAVISHVDQVVDRFIGPGKHRFRIDGAVGHHDSVILRWEMVSCSSNGYSDWGINVLTLDASQRIKTDVQFVAPAWND